MTDALYLNTLQNDSAQKGLTVAVASGKGGVGKTSCTLNLAHILAKQGKRVLVFDADIGLANIDVQLGLSPQSDLSDVLQGAKELPDIVLTAPQGFDLIPGHSGSDRGALLSSLERHNVLRNLKALAANYDITLLDVAAGIDAQAIGFAVFADRTVLVVTPDPSSLTDAYAFVKLLKLRHDRTPCVALINQAATVQEGEDTYAKLSTAAEKFLGVTVPHLATIPADRNYGTSVKLQQLLSVAFPNSPATAALEGAALALLGL